MNHISTKQKLIFINLFSLFIIFAFAFVIAENAYQKYKNYQYIHNTVETSLQLNSLLHEIQKERAVSSGYVSSKDDTFTLLLQNKHDDVNTKMKSVSSLYLNKLDLPNSLKNIRKKVSDKSIDSKKAIELYSNINQDIIDIIQDFSNTPHDLKIRDLFRNLGIFINIKEQVGIEKAILTSVFTVNQFNLEQYNQTSALDFEQKILLKIFLRTTTPNLKLEYKEMSQDRYFQEVEGMKQKAFFKYQNIGINNLYWLELATNKIESLKTFENEIILQVGELSREKSLESFSDLTLIVSITGIIFLYTFLITYSIGKNIVNSYKKIKNTLTIIDDNVIVSHTDKEGIITYVSNAFSKISGYSSDDLIGRSYNILKHKDIQKETFSEIWKTIKDNKTWIGEVKNKKKDGLFYWAKTTITPKYSENGEILGYMAISQDITDKKLVEKLSISDGLTDLFNRRHFETIFPSLINNARRHNQRVCFLMFDVDYFKAYNDTYGHQKGDEVLVRIAKTLKKNIKRAGDFPFRLGGEEFGVLYQTDSQSDAVYFANKLKATIQNLAIQHEGSDNYKVITVSMGLICSEINQADTADSLYKKVDDLLYQAKATGRNKLVSM